MNKTYKFDTSMLPKNLVGYDSFLEQILAFSDGFQKSAMAANPFPPYNIIKVDDVTYRIEVAVAGFSRDNITIDLQDGVLTIKSVDDEDTDKSEYVYQGIAKRNFERVFRLVEDVEVKGAELVDGMLIVNLERVIPEAKKPRIITID